MIYIFSKVNLETKQASNFIVGSLKINIDEEINSKSEVQIIKKANIVKGDYCYINNHFLIIADVQEENNTNVLKLVLEDISNLFNRVIIENSDDMATIGVEAYIANCIQRAIVQPSDNLLAIPYIDIFTTSTTKLVEPTNSSNGLFNLKTFITNCRKNKNIYVTFSINDSDKLNKRLEVIIGNNIKPTVVFDTTVNEIQNLIVEYESDVVAKVELYLSETKEIKNYYLRSDETITEDVNDPLRVVGSTLAMQSVKLDETAIENVNNAFKDNKYNHLIEFEIKKNSKLAPFESYSVGSPALVKVKDLDGYKQYITYISSISETNDAFVNIKTGQIRLSLTDKIKQSNEQLKQHKVVYDNKNIINVGAVGTGSGPSPSFEFPVGSLFVTATNQTPNLVGTWELVDKKWAKRYANIEKSLSASTMNAYIYWNKDFIEVEFSCVLKTTLSDTTVTLGTLDNSEIGFIEDGVGVNKNSVIGYSDSGNFMFGGHLLYISSATPNRLYLQSNDTYDSTGESGDLVRCNVSFTSRDPLNKIDSFCDEFIWRRID